MSSETLPSDGVLAEDRFTFGRLCRDVAALVKGMAITFRYISHPSEVVTRQYPENRATLKFPEAYRGRIDMPHDENGDHNCTACTMCEKACPNGSISVLTTRNLAGKKVLGEYLYRLSSCTLCNLCVEACPFDAIRMGHGFEMATRTREELDMVLNRKEGR